MPLRELNQICYNPTNWHSHEILFGWYVAVISLFLLTAVRNWINHPISAWKSLAAPVVLWLYGRIFPFFPSIHSLMADCLNRLWVLPFFLTGIGIPIFRCKNTHNSGYMVVLGVMSLANAEVHLKHFGFSLTETYFGTTMMLKLIISMTVLMCGRVIRFFTQSPLSEAATQISKPIEFGAVGLSIALIFGEVLNLPTELLVILAGLVMIFHALCLIGWHDLRIWETPLLWMLYLGYDLIVVGYGLTAQSKFGGILPFLDKHVFTTGGIGMVTLGTMARI